ncbi:hypothetical protein K8R32_02280 [bacterium]|nr:hypothetical protein [bacterium]
MTGKLLKILWIVIIFLFISLQIYNLIKANYADVVTSLLTVVILLAMIITYWLVDRLVRPKKTDNKELEKENSKIEM